MKEVYNPLCQFVRAHFNILTPFHEADSEANSDLSQHLAAGPDGSHIELSQDYRGGVSRYELVLTS